MGYINSSSLQQRELRVREESSDKVVLSLLSTYSGTALSTSWFALGFFTDGGTETSRGNLARITEPLLRPKQSELSHTGTAEGLGRWGQKSISHGYGLGPESFSLLVSPMCFSF